MEVFISALFIDTRGTFALAFAAASGEMSAELFVSI